MIPLHNVLECFLRRDPLPQHGTDFAVPAWGTTLIFRGTKVLSRIRLPADPALRRDGAPLAAWLVDIASATPPPRAALQVEPLSSIVLHAPFPEIANLVEQALADHAGFLCGDPAPRLWRKLDEDTKAEIALSLRRSLDRVRNGPHISRDGVPRTLPLVILDGMLAAGLDATYAPGWRERASDEFDRLAGQTQAGLAQRAATTPLSRLQDLTRTRGLPGAQAGLRSKAGLCGGKP